MVEDPVPETALLDRDYDERRRILVVEPRVVSAVRAANQLDGPPDKKFFKNLPGGADEKLKKQVKGILELQGERQLLPLTLEETKVLSFPPGHPEQGGVYAGNPVVAARYYPLDSFHRQTFEHKFREAVDLLIGLGPTRLSVYCEKGWGKKFALGLQVPEVAQGKLSFHRLAMSKALFQGRFKSRPPHPPVGGAWFPHEQAWATMVEARLKGEVEQLNLTLEYSDDYGISASFAKQVDRSPFEVGGKFTSFLRTVWCFQADFRPSLLERLGVGSARAEGAGQLQSPEEAGKTDG
jgi:hypothetical protein